MKVEGWNTLKRKKAVRNERVISYWVVGQSRQREAGGSEGQEAVRGRRQ